jgi:hypothetical protein
MSNKVGSIADEIFRELAEPSSLSIASISFWLRTNLGYLNTFLGTDFKIDMGNVADGRDYEISPALDEQEKLIFKLTYHVHYYDVQIRNVLSTAVSDAVIELESDGSRIRKINKIEQSRVYLKAREFHMTELERVTNAYKRNIISPVQVAGNDTVGPSYSINNRIRRNY